MAENSNSRAPAERLADERKRIGFTQTDLAAWLGVSQGRVSQIESGKALPTREQAAQIAARFNIAMKWWGYAPLPNEKEDA